MENDEYKNRDFWKNYMVHWFGEDLIAKWEKYAEIKQIDSINGNINIEVLKNTDPTKPTIVFSHGIAGYARLILPFIIPLYEKGYNVVAPDLDPECYEKPVLICQPEGDEMTPSYHTKKFHERIKSNNKEYVGFMGAHFPTDKESYVKWGLVVDDFIKGVK